MKKFMMGASKKLLDVATDTATTTVNEVKWTLKIYTYIGIAIGLGILSLIGVGLYNLIF